LSKEECFDLVEFADLRVNARKNRHLWRRSGAPGTPFLVCSFYVLFPVHTAIFVDPSSVSSLLRPTYHSYYPFSFNSKDLMELSRT
jgi:hypothetical protein